MRFGWQQSHQDAGDQGTSQDGDLTDYYLNVMLLPEKPYNATLKAAHSEFVTSHAGGGTTATAHTTQRRDDVLARVVDPAREGDCAVLQRDAARRAGGPRRDDDQRRSPVPARRTARACGIRRPQRLRDRRPDGESRAGGSRQQDLPGRQLPQPHGRRLVQRGFRREPHAALGHCTSTTTSAPAISAPRPSTSTNTCSSSTTRSCRAASTTCCRTSTAVTVRSTSQRVDAGFNYLPFLNVSTDLDAFGSRIEYDTGTVETRADPRASPTTTGCRRAAC